MVPATETSRSLVINRNKTRKSGCMLSSVLNKNGNTRIGDRNMVLALRLQTTDTDTGLDHNHNRRKYEYQIGDLVSCGLRTGP